MNKRLKQLKEYRKFLELHNDRCPEYCEHTIRKIDLEIIEIQWKK